MKPATTSEPVEGPWALPDGWRWERLGAVGNWGSGGTPDVKTPSFYGGEIPWYRSGELEDKLLGGSELSITEEGLRKSSAKVVGPKAVLVAMYGATVGKAAITTQPCAINQAIAFCQPSAPMADPSFIFYFILSIRRQLREQAQGGAQPNISQGLLKSQLIPLPPLSTQLQVVTRIEELFTEVGDGEAALERARGDLATWRKALLKAAVTGELTADWRAANPSAETGADLLARILAERRTRWLADPCNRGKRYVEAAGSDTDQLPSLLGGWVWTNIDQISTRVTKGSSPGWQGFDYQPQGVLFVRSQNVGWGNLLLQERVYVDASFNEVESKAVLQDGDVLLNIVGASIGRTCKADRRLHGANTNQAVAGMRLVISEIADFAVSWLISPAGQAAVFKNVVETARANLSLEQVRSIPVPLPPVSEINAVSVAYQEAADAQRSMLVDISEQLQAAATLRQSILAAAFRGDLVA